MSSEWDRKRIGDVGRVITGKTPSTSNSANFDGPYPFITIPDLNQGRYVRKAERSISESGANTLRSCFLPANAVLMSCIATIGKCGITTRPSFTNQQINSVICGPEILPGYLYYVFTQLGGELDAAGGGGSVYTNVSKSRFSDIEIPIPTIREQTEISDFLGALDDRIALIRETNQTLEGIAQAIFKSWFVDFDPVRAKSVGVLPDGMDESTAALFPDSFEDSEFGQIPKGWSVMTFGDVCTVTIGGLWGSDESGGEDLVPAISLRGVDLEHLRRDGFARNAPKRWVKPSAMEKRCIGEKEVLIASSGAGPCGRPLWAGANFESLYGMPVIYSNFVKRFSCGTPARAIYIDRVLAEMRETKEIWNYINGTSIPNLDDKLLFATKKIVVPDSSVLSAFEGFARTIYERLYSQQAQTLASLRDTLLPRLISGQLSLSAAKEEVEKLQPEAL